MALLVDDGDARKGKGLLRVFRYQMFSGGIMRAGNHPGLVDRCSWATVDR
jgi:hypothetical protein